MQTSTAVNKNVFDRIIDSIEWMAAMFVGLVAANILMLGILIFWGIAATSYRGSHITVDLVWSLSNARLKRVIDVLATLVLLFVVTVQTIMLFDKVRGTYNDNVLTYDLNLPTWPFFAVAWMGDVCAVLLIAIRTWRLIFQPDTLQEHPEFKDVE